MQPMSINPEKETIQPLNHNFLAFLKAFEFNNDDIQKIIDTLKNQLEKFYEKTPEYFAIKFALGSIEGVKKSSKREIRKQICYYIYKSLDKTKLKRSEKIKVIAHKLEVKTDCIQNYMRELQL